MTALRRLWWGEMPLADVFWNWGVIGALIINGVTTLAFLLLIMAGRPIAALIAGYAISIPYNLIVTVGIWRAAARYTGNPQWATVARLTSLVGCLVLSLT